MAQPAVLFDVDGTLVDSNYLHVHAWHRAFRKLEVPVECWRIHRAIGMDGSSLVRDLAGADHLESAKELHARFYDELVDLLQPLPGARALLDAVAGLHLQVVLASSAPDDELSTLRKVLGRDDIVSVVTDSSDVESAKPDPDIVEVALERAGVGAERAVFVGDSVWDVRAAARAGVPCIGLLSGGTSRHELEAEGAVTVWKNPQELLERLGDSPIATLGK
jgi:HAD superfamily hydrolase (TIGR01509 family)